MMKIATRQTSINLVSQFAKIDFVNLVVEDDIMHSAYLKGTKHKVYAWDLDLQGENFECPGCSSKMYLKNGMVRVAHFAHASESNCAFARRESETEVAYKMSIFNTLRSRYGVKGSAIEMEYMGISNCQPAIFIRGRKYNIAIELLIDAADIGDIIALSEAYYSLNIGVIWVLPFDNDRLEKMRFKMKEHEKMLYFMNNKNLLFWNLDEKALSVIEFSPAYGGCAEFYDRDQGNMVYYDGKRLRSTFLIKKHIHGIYPEDLKRWVSSKRFEMKTYKYPLPKLIIWKYISNKKN